MLLCAEKDPRTATLMLLYSGIDIGGWIGARGASKMVQASFTDWVDRYIGPEKALGCTALDLYGARCGVVHTFTPVSTLFRTGKAKKVIYAWLPSRVDDLRDMTGMLPSAGEYVAIQGDSLIEAFGSGVKAFLGDINQLPTEELQAITAKIFTLMPSRQAEGLLQLGRAAFGENRP